MSSVAGSTRRSASVANTQKTANSGARALSTVQQSQKRRTDEADNAAELQSQVEELRMQLAEKQEEVEMLEEDLESERRRWVWGKWSGHASHHVSDVTLYHLAWQTNMGTRYPD